MKGVVFCLKGRIESGCDKRSHVERLAETRASALEEAFALFASGLPRDRSKPGEACGGLVLDRAKLGHLDEDDESGDPADAG
jgi:hypothetical protein